MPQWTQETIATAVAAWSRSKSSDKPLSLREVSKMYNIPRETLRSYVRGQAIGSRTGPPAALSAQEEDGLLEGLIERHATGFPATRQQLKLFVLDLVRDGRAHRFRATGPSDKWVAAFLERHKNRINVRKARILDANRVDAFYGDAISCFFAEYQDYLSKHDFPATRIYNCDETGVDPHGGSSSKVITRRRAKNVAVKRGANRENTSILMTVNEAGGVVPPLFIYKGKRLRSDLLSGAPPGSKATVTESAFIDSVTFEAWIGHFVENIPPARPVLLLLDNHASHVAIEVLEKCRVNQIDVLSLPPHATHLMQPLDAGCFRSFKSEWRKCIANFAAVTNGAKVQKHHIAALTQKTIDAAWGPRIISTSWSSTGMWPVNPGKVFSKSVLSSDLSGRSNYAG